jgi:hypothetical protein
MTLDELLKQNAAWLEQALTRPVFDKVDDKTIKFPEEQREQRMAELKVRIKDLSRRKEEAAASYDRAIALEKAELENLSAQKPPTAPTDLVKPKRDNAR